jgi:hypothetical protein
MLMFRVKIFSLYQLEFCHLHPYQMCKWNLWKLHIDYVWFVQEKIGSINNENSWHLDSKGF